MKQLRWSGFVVSFITISAFMTPLPARAQEATQSASVDADQADKPYAKPAPPAPLTDEERQPVLDLSDLSGIWPDDVVSATPGASDPDSPQDAIAGADLSTKDGSATADVYDIGDGVGEHLALVEAEPQNVLNQDGAWVDLDTGLLTVPAGWEWTDAFGVTYTFPSRLSEETPLQVQTSEGTLTFVPTTDAKSGPVAGSVEGATVTYPGAFGGADLGYTAMGSGVQDEILLGKAPDEATFRFSVGASGLGLVPNAYGGIDVMTADGEVLGRIPAAVAYDSSDDVASATATYELAKRDDGSFELAATFDPAFFADAVYPVVVDPIWNQQFGTQRDAYVDQANPSTSYESNVNLKVDSGKRTFIKFDVSGLSRADRIVYSAQMFLLQTATGA